MTRKDVLDTVGSLTAEKQVEWMFDLGYLLTVFARGAYVVQELDGDAVRLMGFNELQHQVYGRSRDLRCGEDWTPESFLDGLMERAKVYKIEGDLGGAMQASLKNLNQ